jgi:hypothetical protein
VNDVEKSTAAYCIVLHIALCATQIESTDMMCICFFYAKVLGKRCVWYVMVITLRILARTCGVVFNFQNTMKNQRIMSEEAVSVVM